MPWLKGQQPSVQAVAQDGIYTRLSDGSSVIDCRSMCQDSGLPIAVIKSEIEHKYMHGRHFYKNLGSMVERDCYESWKAERLARIKEALRKDEPDTKA